MTAQTKWNFVMHRTDISRRATQHEDSMHGPLRGRTTSGTRRAPTSLSEQTLRRICNEYIEMPALRLTLKQAQRLWGLDEETCRSALACLVDAKFLARVDDHVYARLIAGAAGMPPLRMAKADAFLTGPRHRRTPAGRKAALP